MDPSLALAAGAVLISGAALGVSIWQPFLAQRLTVAQVAATAIIDSVGATREAIWASAEVRPDPDIMARLAYDLDRTCRAHQRSLPPGLRSVRREVRAAATNYLGGATAYAVDPHLRKLPFSEHERYWWDITTTYLDYVVDTLGQWRSHPRARQVDLVPFHLWRRGEDEDYRAYRDRASSDSAGLCKCGDRPALVQSDQELGAPEPGGFDAPIGSALDGSNT